MKIVLTKEDLTRLSINTRKELFELIGGVDEMKNKMCDKNEFPYEMTLHMTKRFMQGIADKTKSFLRVFAENNGIGKIDDLLKTTGGETLIDLNGVQAGITRRLRKMDIDNESEVRLLEWEEDNVSEHEGYFRISKITCDSLKKYFNIK